MHVLVTVHTCLCVYIPPRPPAMASAAPNTSPIDMTQIKFDPTEHPHRRCEPFPLPICCSRTHGTADSSGSLGMDP